MVKMAIMKISLFSTLLFLQGS